MQAIRTKWFPQTDRSPARIKASAEGGSVTLSCHGAELNDIDRDEDVHQRAAWALMEKMGWNELKVRLESGVFGGDFYHVMVKN